MKTRQILYSPLFIQDFEDAYAWYGDASAGGVGDRFLDAVDVTVKLLATEPGVGRKVKARSAKLENLRCFRVTHPFDSYLIFYRCVEDEVFVDRVLHGARDLPKVLKKR